MIGGKFWVWVYSIFNNLKLKRFVLPRDLWFREVNEQFICFHFHCCKIVSSIGRLFAHSNRLQSLLSWFFVFFSLCSLLCISLSLKIAIIFNLNRFTRCSANKIPSCKHWISIEIKKLFLSPQSSTLARFSDMGKRRNFFALPVFAHSTLHIPNTCCRWCCELAH